MMKFNLENSALLLAAIGALNWGLTIFDFNLVEKLLGTIYPAGTTIVYAIVGISGAYLLYNMFMK